MTQMEQWISEAELSISLGQYDWQLGIFGGANGVFVSGLSLQPFRIREMKWTSYLLVYLA